ncbi:MAG: branched-chain amino acid ABC transporter permease [Candidatus Odinarchaeota archaeon]
MISKKSIKNKLSGSQNYLTTWIKSFSGSLTILCMIILFLLPFFSQEGEYVNYFLPEFTFFFIYAILAASWDIVTGLAGQANFGQSIFFGLAGYMGGFLLLEWGFNPWMAIIVSVIGATFIGFLVGIPSLKIKGPYLMLVTLTVSFIILRLIAISPEGPPFYGHEGMSSIPPLTDDPIIEYFILYISLIISFIIMMWIARSKFGTILKSIRDDEIGSEASGINTMKYKLYAFMLCALFSGLAGVYFALHYHVVNPSGNLSMGVSFLAIIMAALGGIGTIRGSLVGAFFYVFLEFILLEIGFELDLVRILFSIILILVIRFASRGILAPLLDRLRELWDVLLGR